MNKKVVLVITDGIGFNESVEHNAFANAKKPVYDKLFKDTPYSYIATYGNSVGLPIGQMGNSEVGHMTMGSGRIIFQDLVKISKSIEDGSIKSNSALNSLLEQTSRVHIFGLVSDGGVHSHIEHIKELSKIAKDLNKEVFLHIVTDGRDVSPTSGISFVKDLLSVCLDNVKIATISGRFYAMDRDNRWERVKKAYDEIVDAKTRSSVNVLDYIQNSYQESITDEFIEPISFDSYSGVKDGDGFIMANFRSDRAREISALLGDYDFLPIDVNKKKIKLITMTQYSKDFSFPILFQKDNLDNVLAEVISSNNLTQFHTAETEKYAHVTFFFNGGVEEPYLNETRVLIPSPKVKTYDLQPQMSANEVGDSVVKAINEKYNFIVVNFANGDMVGHTGNYKQAIKAVECVDFNLGKIIEACDKNDYSLIITSDHGNCEKMKDQNGDILTNHTVGDVFCFIRSKNVKSVKSGGLNNIAPTVLKLMELKIPKEMDEALI